MDLKRLFTDDEAVSPVVGVTMMIAIAVVLAAVVGMLVLNMGQGQGQTPTASFEFNKVGSSNVTAVHDGGDNLTASQLEVTKNGNPATATINHGGDGGLSAGETIDVDSLNSGDVVRIVWSAPDSDKSSVIAKYKFE